MKVGVIDYGVGNLGSVIRALEELQATPILIAQASEFHNADRLILPGVGNFTDCVNLLEEGGWIEALKHAVQADRKPLLGVCVGMQLLANSGMEGAGSDSQDGTLGLGLIPGRVEHLTILGCTLPIPHVGWNAVTHQSDSEGLFEGVPDGTDFYFVHSYAFVPEMESDVLATTDYGIPITVAVKHGNVWGTQFHPEKSSRAGFKLLRNFIENSVC